MKNHFFVEVVLFESKFNHFDFGLNSGIKIIKIPIPISNTKRKIIFKSLWNIFILPIKKDNPNMAIANNITSSPSHDKKISNLLTFIFSFYQLMNYEQELYYNTNKRIVEIKNRIALS